MIRVCHLTKKYASTTALDDISFEVARGEVVGLLGPNGAGKTTTLRILSCFLPPTEGTVEVAGLDAWSRSLEVRRLIGYLPENNPLYPEMRVDEYLRFRAALKKVPRGALAERVDGVVKKCGLAAERRRVIGTLSKGTRQRVGLAEALVHDPQLLILDEPTIGLDPHQVRQVRDLIRDLGRERTVLLSTHILPEVEAVCSRVIIINRGKIVAMDSPQNLVEKMAGSVELRVEVKGPFEEMQQSFSSLPHVVACAGDRIRNNGWSRFYLEIEAQMDVREELFHLVAKKGWALRELKGTSRTLEDVFVHITTQEPDPS